MQGSLNGGREYVKRILDQLLSESSKYEYISVYALFDSKKKFLEDDKKKYSTCFTEWIDINCIKQSIGEWINKREINVFFIGILQRYASYDLSKVKCKAIAVIHDDGGPEIIRNKIYRLKPYINILDITKRYVLDILDYIGIKKIEDFSHEIDSHKDFLMKENTSVVTVSDYSKKSIQYNHPFLRQKKISILYSPLRNTPHFKIQKQIANLIENKANYFVALSADRWQKNIKMVFSVFREFSKIHSNCYLVTTGVEKSFFSHHIGLPYLEEEELNYVIKNAQALIYSTYNEGFGYPPIEAMRYNVPVISSYETSLPEVLGDSALFFSPLHESDLWRCLTIFEDMDQEKLKAVLQKQYEKISKRQITDLNTLIKLIIGDC